jgi:cytochrome c-type biogenesis protein CcmH/NrfF
VKGILLSLVFLVCGAVMAAEATSPDENRALEGSVIKVASELRCLVCQNQSLADSHSALALDLKREIREQFVQGKSDQDVVDFMVARYGDFVRYRPPWKITTLLLWLGPLLFMMVAAVMLFLFFRKPGSEN